MECEHDLPKGMRCEVCFPMETKRYRVGQIIRMPHYSTTGGFRCWRITGQHLGGEYQEGIYSLFPIDIHANEPIEIPCIILETHPLIELM